ncbi:MAG TPA: hypothetical protein VK875_00445 [Euzebyales bacterium]|nr:hypothetical protein [Euzebyales bacterium]
MVAVGQHDGVQRADPALRQLACDQLGIGAAVDEHPGTVPAAGRLDQQPVALADVQRGQAQVLRRGCGQAQRHHGCDQRHRRAAGHQRRRDPQHQQDRHQGHAGGDVRRRERRQPHEGGRRPPQHPQRHPGRVGQHLRARQRGRGQRGRHQPQRLGPRGGGRRDQVGGQRRQRHGARHRQHDGRGRDLRPSRGRHHQRQAATAGRPPRRHQHPARGQDRQREPDLARQQRVDRQQHEDRHRQRVHAVAHAAAQHPDERDAGHDGRPHDRGLPAGEQHEPPQCEQGGAAPAPQAQTAGRRHHHQTGQQHRHVPPGHHDQVRQAGGGQLLGRQVVPRPQHEAAQQRRTLRRQDGREGRERAPADDRGRCDGRRRRARPHVPHRVGGRDHTEAAQVHPEGAVRWRRHPRDGRHGLADRQSGPVGAQQDAGGDPTAVGRRHPHQQPRAVRRGPRLGDDAAADRQRCAGAARGGDRRRARQDLAAPCEPGAEQDDGQAHERQRPGPAPARHRPQRDGQQRERGGRAQR